MGPSQTIIPRMAGSVSGSATRTPPGGIAPRSPRARGGGFYGYKIHAAVCTRTGLPLAWETRTAKDAEATVAIPLIDAVIGRGLTPETAAADKGYDSGAIQDAFLERDCRPVIPLRNDPRAIPEPPPCCQHGAWTFAGSDYKRGASKWRCPTGECRPGSIWIKASRKNPLIPRETKRWKALYRGRAAVEREFGNLKHDYGSPFSACAALSVSRFTWTSRCSPDSRWRGRAPCRSLFSPSP